MILKDCCSTYGPAEELKHNPLFVYHGTRVGGQHTWVMRFWELANTCCTSFLFCQVTLCPNTVGEYKLELVLDVEDVGKKVFALPLTARYQQLPCTCLSFLQHPAPAHCLAAAPKEKCCFMSCICPSRHEKSARKAAHSEIPPCSQPAMALDLFLKGAEITLLIVGLGFGA